MTYSLALSSLSWTLEGWRQWDWDLTKAASREHRRIVGPLPASFPGSVRSALVAAGMVPNPYSGTDSRASEWIENRHWVYGTRLPCDLPQGRLRVVFSSLDGPGAVWIAGEQVAEFNITHLPVTIELDDAPKYAGSQIRVVFTTPPDEIGAVFWSSRIRAWKPRFNYGWDFLPRLVQLGPARDALLSVETGPRIGVVGVQPSFVPTEKGRGSGRVLVNADIVNGAGCGIRVSLTDREGHSLAEASSEDPGQGLELCVDDVASWWSGEIPGEMYELTVSAVREGAEVARTTRRIGFRSAEWVTNPGAPAEATPWLLQMDGSPVFLRGVNWVPIRPDYADVLLDEYVRRLDEYVAMGVNLIRVWGGAGRERDEFYDLCDDRRLLIWQDLPIAASGHGNRPPEDFEYAEQFARIARQYAEDLHHHPGLVIWSGGNELAGKVGEPVSQDRPGDPIDFSHPAIAAAAEALRQGGATQRIVPTTPSGPRFHGNEDEFGLGLHWDVHGPWVPSANESEWRDYWSHDDALFRSEVGAAGASGLEVLERYGLDEPGNDGFLPLWRHSSSWWLEGLAGPESADALPGWVAESQERQARLLGIAAEVTANRFPQCGGFMVWMGHDCFPCAVSLSLLDFEGRPKPAAAALGAVFRRDIEGPIHVGVKETGS